MNILDKEEFRVKLGQINKLVETQDYKGAMQIVDSIDWRRVKNVRTLCVVGEIYAANKRYEESKEIFLLAYHRAPIGKNILYRLIEVSLKMGQISEATEFFDEYREVAGNDNSQYILKYKIARAKNASLNEQIRILEEYKEKEFTERWSYELAKLYYKAGDKQKCLDLCNEMILWFNDGTYVIKALDLKQRMGVLTGEEKEKYEQRFIPKLIPPEKAQEIRESKEASGEYGEAKPVTDTIQVDDERDLNSAETFQEKLSKGFRDIFGGHKKSAEEDMEEKEAAQDEEQEEVSTGSEDVTEQAEVPEAETAAAAEPSEEFTDSEEIEAAEGSEEASEEQEEFSGQEVDEIPLASGVENLSSGSIKLQAQEQQDKEEEEAYQEAEEAEAEKATEMSLSQSVAEIMKEKAAGNEENEEKPAGVPLNEEGKPDFSATIRMPELKIPKSMINVDPENASSSAEMPDASGIFGSIEDIAASVGDRSEKDKDKDFNLEDTILAAATQQGIDIPEEEKSPDVQQSDVTEEPAGIEDLDIAADEFVPEEPDAADIEDIMAQISAQQEEEVTETSDTRIPDIVFDEDEEPVTEEDLQAAEAEFLNGPSGVQKPVEEDDVLPEIPSLESEAQVQKSAAEPSAKLHHEEPVAAAEEENLLDEEEEYSDDAFNFQDEDDEDDFISSPIGDDSDEAMEEDDEEDELSEEEQLEKFIATIHPEKDPTKIVSRKKELTEEEKKLFTYFVTVPGMKEQLLDVLCNVQMGAADKTSQTGNVIVMGGRETGKTRLISSLIPAICKELNIEASKVAYIFADDLNGKDIPEIVSKLAGGFLVIEDANQLSQETADELEEAMTGNTKGMIVILEDEKIGMRKLEVVRVGGFLHCQIEPVAGVAVRPGVHACQQVAVLLRDPVQHTVDHGHGLRAGDVGVGTEAAVLEALDPAQLRGPLDILLSPVALDVGESLGAAALAGVEPGANGGELSAGDGRLGIEGRGAAALHDAQTRHGGDGRVGPVIVRHVGVGVAGQQIAVTDGILQQTEEDGGGLRTGDQAVGPDIAVLVADDVGEVVAVVQQIGGDAAVVPHRLGLLLCRGLIGGQVILFHADLAAAHNVPLRSGQLLIVQLALGIDLAVIALGNPEQGDAAAVGGRRGDLLAVQIQSELRAVQGVAVLRVHLFNGEIVVGGGAAATGGLHRIGNRGLREYLPPSPAAPALFLAFRTALSLVNRGLFGGNISGFHPSDPPHRRCRDRFRAWPA